RKANLRGTSLTGTRLDKADLKGADLTGVRSGKVRGKPRVLPKGWVLAKGYLVGPGANLDQAQLRGADLSRANLRGTSLAGARLDGAKLAGKSYSGIKGKPKKLPAGWRLVGRALKKR
ncbi:MAG: pentapeptide repeat-containing protein, partial [bacterium]